MMESDFLKHLKRMSILIDKRVSSNYIGERHSIHTGKGTLFKDHGLYAPGDDIRDVDWKVFGRTDKLHIKRYEEDKALTVHVIIDSSSSMNYGSTDTTKFDYASMIGIAFAYMAMQRNEKFRLCTFSDQLDQIEARKGKRQLTTVIDQLKTKKAEGKSNFESSMLAYLKKIESRSMIVVISDFFYDLKEIERSLKQFKNADIKLIQVLDDVEENLKLQGDLKLKDLETKNTMRAFIDNMTRKKYLKKKNEHNKKLSWIANGIGAKYYHITTDTPIFDTIYEIFNN